jgi:hypothetical protein
MEQPHQEKADALEHELDAMEHESSKLESEIDEAREDYERKKRDPNVPGAGGDPAAAEGGTPPEANEVQSGD